MVQKFKTVSDAIALAEFAHRSQVDRAGLPYIEHPKRVLEKVRAQGGLPYVQMAAVLHDVTEDTAFTPEMLLGLGFPESAVEIVRLVDRHESKSLWDDLLEPIIDSDEYYYIRISENPGAKMVKLSDIDDNTEPWRLSYLTEQTQDRLIAKYTKARELLG